MEEDTVILWNHCRSTWLSSISKQSCHLSSVHLITCCNIAGVIIYTAAEMHSRRCCKSLIFTWVLMWTHAKKSKGVRSGEHAAKTHGEPLPIQRPGSVSSRELCTMCAKCGRAPSCYNTTKSRMLSGNNCGRVNCSSMSNYDDGIIVASAKKNGS